MESRPKSIISVRWRNMMTIQARYVEFVEFSLCLNTSTCRTFILIFTYTSICSARSVSFCTPWDWHLVLKYLRRPRGRAWRGRRKRRNGLEKNRRRKVLLFFVDSFPARFFFFLVPIICSLVSLRMVLKVFSFIFCLRRRHDCLKISFLK